MTRPTERDGTPATAARRGGGALQRRLLLLAEGDNAERWLALVAFAEASFFPLPPDLLLIPMVLAVPARAFRFALVCTIASVVGGIAGWVIGATLFERLALPIARLYHAEPSLLHVADRLRANGLWLVLIKGLTPIPYKIVSIAAGAVGFSLPLFVAASVVTRGARFFLLAWLLRRFGGPARRFIEGRLTLVTTAVVAVGIAAFLALRLL